MLHEKAGGTIVEYTPEEEAAHIADVAASMTASRIAEITARLASIDMESIKALRVTGIGRGGAPDVTKLTELEDESEDLRTELATL